MTKMISLLQHYARRAYRAIWPLLYARSNYKLFLQRTFESLDLRLTATLAATNALSGIVNPVPIRAPFGKSMLVVAPHQDDEMIGCGGAILLHRAAGQQVSIVFTQDGGDEHAEDGNSRAEQVSLREREASQVADALGIPVPTFLRGTTLSGSEAESLSIRLRAEILRTQADSIFTPFFLDYNHHHQRSNYILARALSGIEKSRTVYCFEVWGLTIPNVILNIDSVMDDKRRLLGLHASQMRGKDYVHGVTGLNMFHSLHFGAGECKFAERYFEIPAVDFVRVVNAIRERVASPNDDTERLF